MNKRIIFETVSPYPKRIYIIPSYLSVLKLQNYSSQCNSCAFFRKIEENLSWVIEAINEASATNSIMNLSHTLFVIADAKALCSILYSSGNIQIKRCWGTQLTKTSVFRESIYSLLLKIWGIISNCWGCTATVSLSAFAFPHF